MAVHRADDVGGVAMIRAAQSRGNSRGFVMLIAVLMLGIVGAALAVLTLGINIDSHRTTNRLLDAQLEQMLLAANAEAPSKLAANPTANQSWQINLPADLADSGATLTMRVQSIDSPDAVTCFIRASLDRRLAEQTVQLHRNAGKWQLVSTQLNGD
jgi:hypothetical protein